MPRLGKEMQWEKRHGLHDMQVVYGQTQTAYRRSQGNAQGRARQCMGTRKVVHRQRKAVHQ